MHITVLQGFLDRWCWRSGAIQRVSATQYLLVKLWSQLNKHASIERYTDCVNTSKTNRLPNYKLYLHTASLTPPPLSRPHTLLFLPTSLTQQFEKTSNTFEVFALPVVKKDHRK